MLSKETFCEALRKIQGDRPKTKKKWRRKYRQSIVYN